MCLFHFLTVMTLTHISGSWLAIAFSPLGPSAVTTGGCANDHVDVMCSRVGDGSLRVTHDPCDPLNTRPIAYPDV